MEKICDKCIHCYKPTSVKDFFDKTMKMPDIHKWGVDVFKHLFWLCDTEPVSEKVHTNGSMLMKQCIEQNFHGNCESFRASSAEDIVPSLVEVPVPNEIIREGDEVSLTVTITPATIPAVTEDITVSKEVEIVDENGGLILDENGQPQYQVVDVTETIIVVPEHENDQDIAYKYQWYKNGRKLFKETKETITIDTSKAEVAEYFCAVSQYIKNNGDGGKKSVEVVSNIVPIEVIGVNKILLHLSAGTDPTSIPLPFTPALIHVPYSLTNGWTITNIEATDQVILTDADVPNVTIECSDGIRAVFDEGLEISGKTGTVLLKWDAE